jgi:hypothetical protein
MMLRPIIERLVYALIVVLSLLALWLVASVTPNFLSAHAVYQGF